MAQVRKIAVSHRVGVLDIGETAVVIAVSTPHRKERLPPANTSSMAESHRAHLEKKRLLPMAKPGFRNIPEEG
ncbi:MAG: molybdenum cofactor biosynthesis protein MoaE [Calditrichia bacterium]